MHRHADHLGQFPLDHGAFTAAEVWSSGATQNFQHALAALEASDAACDEPRSGDATTVGRPRVEFPNPGEDANFADLHNSHHAFRVTYGTCRFCSPATPPRPEQRMTARHAGLLAADIYQVRPRPCVRSGGLVESHSASSHSKPLDTRALDAR